VCPSAVGYPFRRSVHFRQFRRVRPGAALVGRPGLRAADVVGETLHAGSSVSAKAMGSSVTLDMVMSDRATVDAEQAASEALEVFALVEQACSRFDPHSDLSRANEQPQKHVRVSDWCYVALREAYDAYQASDGLFDPRVLADLLRLGYSTTMPSDPGAIPGDIEVRPEWQPEFDDDHRSVRLGWPVDLGGIGKGLAVRWAAEQLAEQCAGFLLAAGGDCYAHGYSALGQPWRIAVEDPLGGDAIALLAVHDTAVVTSSVRVHAWTVDGRNVHHLIDPRTGMPGGEGLRAVTVVHPDPATAEVFSKCLFLQGADRIPMLARQASVPALWVHDDGLVDMSETMLPWTVVR
jgi:FAD:protein FMN transferase